MSIAEATGRPKLKNCACCGILLGQIRGLDGSNNLVYASECVDHPKPFLTAQWRHLALLNFEIARELLDPLAPAGTIVDT
ncbi:MAG: hypothetical protein ACREXY_24540, partial [Gammaproteobacteria bacterium]